MQTAQNYELPATAAQQAGTYGLGSYLGIYRPLLGSKLAVFGMMVGVIIADILLLIVVAALTGYIFYILIAIPIIAIIYGIYAFGQSDLRVYEFSNGLIHVKGDQMQPIRWDQVTSVIQQQRRNRGYMYGGLLGGLIGGAIAGGASSSQSFTIQRNDGAIFKFTSILRKVGQLGQNIQQAVTQHHMPQAMAAYNSGTSIPFGPLTVSVQGLSNGREVVPWIEIQSAEIKQGQLIVKRTGKTFAWAKYDVSVIPNILVFMSLVNYARTGVYA